MLVHAHELQCVIVIVFTDESLTVVGTNWCNTKKLKNVTEEMVQVMETSQGYAPLCTHNTEGNLLCTCVYHIIAFFTFHPLLSWAKILSCKFFCHVPMI